MEDLLENYPAALSISAVAEILSVTPATVRRYVKSDELPHFRVGSLVRIPKDSLISYLNGTKTTVKEVDSYEKQP